MSYSQIKLLVKDNLWLVLLSLFCLGFYGYHLSSLSYIVDDAYISFRYLDNFIAGEGLVYNPGDRVEGYSNFLWIMALAPFRWLGLKAETAAMLLSMVSYLILCWSVSKSALLVTGDLMIDKKQFLILPTLLLTSSAHLAGWSVSGMETVFYTMLLSVATSFILLQKPALGAFIFSLAALTRPEGIALGALSLFIYYCYQMLNRESLPKIIYQSILPLMLFVTPISFHLLFRYEYYGELLPNTYFVKLSGNELNLIPAGLKYLTGYLTSGGLFLLIPGLLSLLLILFSKEKLKAGILFWGSSILLVQIIFYLVYVVMVGGDYFPFHRFLVPAIPALCIMTTYLLLRGHEKLLSCSWPRPIIIKLSNPLLMSLLIAVFHAAIANTSQQKEAHQAIRATGEERKLIANWIKGNYSAQIVLAVNAAGLIPYITKMPTVDMLGLNDASIAKQPVRQNIFGGASFVGHLKHDGDYVCRKKPGLVLTAGARLNKGRSAAEASYQAALNSFEGDREFLNSKDCKNAYQARVEELVAGNFLVIYEKIPEQKDRSEALLSKDQNQFEASAKAWFDRGLEYMAKADLGMAIHSFGESLKLNPNSPSARINLAYSYLDFQKTREALEQFKLLSNKYPNNYEILYGLALATEKNGEIQSAKLLWEKYIQDAPDSVWKEKARHNFRLLDD